MITSINWEKLADQLGLLTENGESAGSNDAKKALEIIIGEEVLQASVDYYITGNRGSELARHVLWQLRPWSVMNYCYRISKESSDIHVRTMALDLLKVVADRRVLPWISELLEDNNIEIQYQGVRILDQLLWSELIEVEEGEPLIVKAEKLEDAAIRENVEFIRGFLQTRSEMQNRAANS